MLFQHQAKIYLSPGSTDLRKSIQGLSLLVEAQGEYEVFSGSIFGFCNRSKKLIKLLYWDTNGFCLWMKRLEKSQFPWPEKGETQVELSPRELNWLLTGLTIQQAQAHPKLQYSALS